MTGRDLLYAIAQADEAYIRESERFSDVSAEIKKERQRTQLRIASVGIAAAVCAAVFGAVKFAPRPPEPVTQTDSATIHTTTQNTSAASTVPGVSSAADGTTKKDEPPAQTYTRETATTAAEPTAEPYTENVSADLTATKETDVQPPTTAAPAETKTAETGAPPVEGSTYAESAPEPSSVLPTTADGSEGGTAVYRDLAVDYDTARESFGYPILPYAGGGFNGYSVLLVNRNGNLNESGTECLSVTYLFTNGSVELRDQARTGEITPTGNAYEYRGETFYVHTPEFNGDQLRIGYYPTGKSGLAYQAHFNGRADMDEIMDLILSLTL